MVASLLLDFDIQEAGQLIQRLDAAGLPPVAAFWLHDPNAEKWRLILAYEEFDEEGSLSVHEKILPFAEPGSDLALFRITATGLGDEHVKLVRAQLAGHAVSLDRPWHTMIKGRDVIVYRA